MATFRYGPAPTETSPCMFNVILKLWRAPQTHATGFVRLLILRSRPGPSMKESGDEATNAA